MRRLKNGWVEGSVKDFLDLSDADVEYIETRRALNGDRKPTVPQDDRMKAKGQVTP